MVKDFNMISLKEKQARSSILGNLKAMINKFSLIY